MLQFFTYGILITFIKDTLNSGSVCYLIYYRKILVFFFLPSCFQERPKLKDLLLFY